MNIPEVAMVNKERYKEVLACLQEKICLRCLRVATYWVLLHDNALPHVEKHGTVVLPNLPYSPDLALYDFSSLFR